MIIIQSKNYKEMSRIACEIVVDEIKKKPNLVIGLPSGKTPLGLYKELAFLYKKGRVSFSKVNSFNLDEYYPISKKNPNSYHYYMFQNFFNKVNFNKKNINILDGEVQDYKKECKDYEKKFKKNRIDLMILGVGKNGHIAFNEPYSSFRSKTRLVELSKETINNNSKFFKNKNKMPSKALSIGIKTIMQSKKIILLASGKNKSLAINNLIKGKINNKWPVSILKKHKNLLVILDKKAGGLLK